jgi:hypothetical protein
MSAGRIPRAEIPSGNFSSRSGPEAALSTGAVRLIGSAVQARKLSASPIRNQLRLLSFIYSGETGVVSPDHIALRLGAWGGGE